MKVDIYTDGSCWPPKGPGGWASVTLGSGFHWERSGAVQHTTVNRMEITAVLNALTALPSPYDITIYSDSQYVCRSMGDWIRGKPNFLNVGWIHRWRHQGKLEILESVVKNRDLWRLVYDECFRHVSISTVWIRGHSGDKYNERCDVLAGEARRTISIDKSLYPDKFKYPSRQLDKIEMGIQGEELPPPHKCEGFKCHSELDNLTDNREN